jgi:uncharacterized protein (DUF1697 family)
VPTHVALLRGINVGGRNLVAMPALRDAVSSLGHSDVATYIQSGNVVFTSASDDTTSLAQAMEREIAETLGVRPSVVVLSKAELAAVVATNPFPDETNPKALHVMVASERLCPDDVRAVNAAEQKAREKGSSDEARVQGRTVFLRTPGGLGRSALAAALSKPAEAMQLTARNWATVTKLLHMLED